MTDTYHAVTYGREYELRHCPSCDRHGWWSVDTERCPHCGNLSLLADVPQDNDEFARMVGGDDGQA